MNGFKGYPCDDPLGLNPPSLTAPYDMQANYATLFISDPSELDDIPRLVERIERVLESARGYVLAGQNDALQKIVDERRMEIFMKTQAYQNDQRNAAVTKEAAAALVQNRAAYAKDFLIALIATPPVFKQQYPDQNQQHYGGAGFGGQLVQASPDPDPARLAPLAVAFADELIKALGGVK